MTREDAVDKIRKMLRLARDKGASEAEAMNAMAMAQKLMMQHNIDQVEEQVEELAVRGDWHDFGMDKKWQMTLAQAVGKLYSCRVVMQGKARVRFVGKPSNVLVCADTLQWIVDQMQELYKKGLLTFRLELGGTLAKRVRGDFRLSFKEACALRIYSRCCDIVAAARNDIPAHMALVVIDQALAAADDLLRADGVRTSGKSMKFRPGFGTGAGRAAGDQVKLQHSVNPSPRLIGNS